MHKFNGDYIGSITTDGTLALNKPEDVCVDAEGHLYIADTDNNRVLQFNLTMDGPVTTTPAFVRAIAPSVESFSKPCGVSLDEDGALIVTDRDKGMVFRMQSDGDVLGYWDMSHWVNRDVASNTDYFPELARLLRFDQPARAVMDAQGLLAVADTGHHQVRVLRAYSRLKLNLLDIGQGVFEKLPDISLRVVGEGDWRDTLGLRVDMDKEFETEPDENVATDDWRYHGLLHSEDFDSVVLNVLKVARTFQKWFKQHSRQAPEERRWGNPDHDLKLDIDIDEDSSFYFHDVNLSREDDGSPHGRGSDGWDDSTIAHEMSHWLFGKTTGPYGLIRDIRISASHTRDSLQSQDLAFSEGWSEFVQHFFGDEYGSNDRIRGFGLSSARLLTVAEENQADRWLYGGLESATPPSFDQPQQGLRNEGYFSNCLYQIYRTISDGEVLFADSSCYWHGYNVHVSDDVATRFSNTIWKAMELYQQDPPWGDASSSVFLTAMLDQFYAQVPQYAQIAQSLLELNNLLMPVITVHEETSPGHLDDALDDEFDLPVTQVKVLVFKVTTVSGQALPAYNLKIEVVSGDSAHYRLEPAGAGPDRQHGRPAPTAPPANEMYRATDADGYVKVRCLAASGAGAHETIKATYQPDFDNDATFAPPQAGDDYATTLRQCYLYELRVAGKLWTGTGNNFGAMVSKQLQINLE